jgi:hypothetical protein
VDVLDAAAAGVRGDAAQVVVRVVVLGSEVRLELVPEREDPVLLPARDLARARAAAACTSVRGASTRGVFTS